MPAPHDPASSPLVGTWRLVAWTATVDGTPVKPFGGSTTGLITYTDDGRMWGTLLMVDRDLIDAPTLAAATADARAAAAAGYLNYAGTYQFQGDHVTHFVEVSLFPNWLGTEQVRSIDWEPNEAGGRDLILSAVSQTKDDKPVENRLRWRRLEDWV